MKHSAAPLARRQSHKGALPVDPERLWGKIQGEASDLVEMSPDLKFLRAQATMPAVLVQCSAAS